MSLLAPLFLLGIVTLAIPIWLHRMAYSDPEKKAFSSVMLLEKSQHFSSTQKRLRYLLLMALRLLLLLLLALAFAAPVLHLTRGDSAVGANRIHLLLMDTSASMSYQGYWSRALQQAREIIRQVPADEAIELISAAQRIDLAAEATTDRGRIAEALNSLEPGSGRLDYGEMTLLLRNRVSALTETARRAGNPAPQIQLHLVSDMQQSALPSRFADLNAAARNISFHDIVPSAPQNRAILGATHFQAAAGSEASGDRIEVTISALEDEDEAVLELYLNDERLEQKTLSLSRGQQRIDFTTVPLEAGDNKLLLSLQPSDNLSADDRYFLVVRKPEAQNVLVLSTDPKQDALYFSAAAQVTGRRLFNLEYAPRIAVAERPLRDYAFVVVADAGELSSEDSEQLRAHLNSGGDAYMILGPASTSLQQLPVLGNPIAPSSLASQSGAAAQNSLNRFAIADIAQGHPLVQGIPGWREIKVFNRIQVDPQQGQKIIGLADGSPLLLEQRLGEGRVILQTSPLLRSWNDFGVQPSYVAFVSALMRYLSGLENQPTQFHPGDTMALSGSGQSVGQVFDPQGNRLLSLSAQGRTQSMLLGDPGFYEVRQFGKVGYIAVNLDPRESQLTPLTDEVRRGWQELIENNEVQADSTNRAGTGQTSGGAADNTRNAENQEQLPLWPYLLALLMLFVITESWLANSYLDVQREPRQGVPGS